jgi:putative transposase
MLFRSAYLSVANVFAVLRLLPGSDRDKDAEILALRHQLAVVQRQLGGQKLRFSPADRALLAAMLHHLPRPQLRGLTLLVRPDTILRWHRDLIVRRHAAASRPPRRGRPPTPPVGPGPGATPGPGEPHVGVPAHPRPNSSSPQ